LSVTRRLNAILFAERVRFISRKYK
jgi:hypothetical protein